MIPRRPQLSPLFTPVREPDGFQFRRDDHRVVFLRGETALHVLPRLLPLLDGSRETSQLRVHGVSQEELSALLEAMDREGLLVEPIEERDPWLATTLAVTRQTPAASVRVIAATPAAEEFERQLRRVGLADSKPVRLTIAVEPISNVIQGPWLRIAWSPAVCEVGPLFVPQQTCCYECFRLRVLSNRRFPDSYLRFEPHAASPIPFAPSVTWCAAQATIEALRFITRFEPPKLCGRLLWFDWERLESGLETVLKVPGCCA